MSHGGQTVKGLSDTEFSEKCVEFNGPGRPCASFVLMVPLVSRFDSGCANGGSRRASVVLSAILYSGDLHN